MLLGAHMSISGGMFMSLERGKSIGCQTIQVFTKNANQWKAKLLTKKDIEDYLEHQRKTGISPVVAHDSYLINLASPDPESYEKSIEAFFIEMERAEKLGIPYLIFHPGAHLGSGEEEGLKRIADSINRVYKRARGFSLKLLLETTAGQGTNLGYSFEQLARIIDLVDKKKYMGVCYDTCHTFAAGYDIRDKSSYNKTFEDFDRVIGLERLKVFHINDSKKGLGSRIDRHEHIGKGMLGIEAFRLLLNDKQFKDTPMILETPKGKEMKEDIMNLKILRGLITL